MEGNRLLHVQLPKKWRIERRDILTNFLRKFGRVLVNRGIKCCGSGCGDICGVTRTRSGAGGALVCSDTANENLYGITMFACSECNEPLCDECQEVDIFPFCEVCEKFFCERCADMNYCSNDNCNSNGCFPCRACAPDAMTSW